MLIELCRPRSEFKRRQKLAQKEKEQAEKKVRFHGARALPGTRVASHAMRTCLARSS